MAQTPGEFLFNESGYGVYKSGDDTRTIVDAETGEIAFRCLPTSFSDDQIKRILQILERVVGKAERRTELRIINTVRRSLLLDELTEV